MSFSVIHVLVYAEFYELFDLGLCYLWVFPKGIGEYIGIICPFADN